MLKRSLVGLALLGGVLGSVQVHAEIVERCHDGDTCHFKNARGKKIKVRFSGFDAPELKQMLGTTARDRLFGILKDKEAELDCSGKSYDRRTCVVMIDGKDVGFDMVASGLALDSPRYSKGKYRTAQEEARTKGLGVWGVKDMRSPACFRNNNRQCATDPMYMP